MQHYMHGVYHFIYAIFEMAVMTVVLWETSNKVNYFTFELAGWMWPNPVGKPVPLTRDTELINSYQLTFTTSSYRT